MAAAMSFGRMGLAALVILATAALPACESGTTMSDPLPVTIAGRTFRLELALDHDARRKGLSERDALADDAGMLFVFPEPEVQGFWMRGCLISLDIIYLDAGGRIVSTKHMPAPPPASRYDEGSLPVYSSEWPAQFAIELKGGTLGSLKLRRGEKIDLPLAELKGSAR